jgi:hypothetical protein
MKHTKKLSLTTVPVAKANVFDDIGNWFHDRGGDTSHDIGNWFHDLGQK